MARTRPSLLRPYGIVAALGMYAVAALVTGTRLRNLGANDADLARPLAGDGILPDAQSSSTMAIAIEAPPWAVWDQLMELRRRHAGSFDAAIVEPGKALVLRASLRVPSGRPYDPHTEHLRWFSDSTWAFVLDHDAAGETRLLVRSRNVSRPRLLLAAADAILWEPARLVIERLRLLDLRGRAEAAHERWSAEPSGARRPPSRVRSRTPRPTRWHARSPLTPTR